ncbi:MAG: hypothetical protein J2P46_01065 [Zavarzinella sp.]|nr:hypothetical protein [Zavarzinella sp.]
MAARRARDKFPFWRHPSGRRAKKQRRQVRYFGTQRDAALKRFVAESDDIRAGRKHRPARDESAASLTDV